MYVRYLGLALLVWFPGTLQAQSAAQPCPAPSLDGGYFVPEQETYDHEAKLTYACDSGRKPAVEGWWATSTCQNGKWSHEPQCIDEKACIAPPTIPNAKPFDNPNDWYEDREKIRITCDKGYIHKDGDATAICTNGTWSSVPVCERSPLACDEPPKIPHAVVTNQEYQEVFAADSAVQYECQDGYAVTDNSKSIICMGGRWTESPTCSRETRPDPGHGGSASGGDTSSAGSETRPVGGASSTNSGSGGRETEPQITTISTCGNPPVVPNGDVVETYHMSLKYECGTFYKRVGPETVVCYSNGRWSATPTCIAAFCKVDTDTYPELTYVGVKYIKDGESVRLTCVMLDHWWLEHYSVGRCRNGRLTLSRCCTWFQLKTNSC